MNVAIIGTYGHPLPLADFKRILPKGRGTKLIIGTEDLVDLEIWAYADEHRLNYLRIVPKGTVIENIRNIIQDAEKVLIFWDGESEKTAAAIKECMAMKKDFTVYTTFKKF
ncbi:MAG: hypothetical protein K2N38_13220 [Oscillospiraceae bacterium]|nr:hypothetical protein [Oscillospiraceae bacterium]